MVLDVSVPRIVLTRILGLLSEAAYYAPPSPLRLVTLPDPPLPAPDWVRVSNRLCGICGSDLHQLFLDASLDVAPAALPSHQRVFLGHEMVGDVVEISGKLGVVKQIQIFNTVLSSPDNIRIIVPNAQVTGGNILNYTINGTRRVDLVIGVSYEDDLKKTREVIEGVIAQDGRVLKEPAPVVAVKELADSSVNFVVRPWVNAVDYWDVYFDMTEKIKVALDSAGITIPFPQRDVHVKNGESTGQALSA